jgi:hypothetical protein
MSVLISVIESEPVFNVVMLLGKHYAINTVQAEQIITRLYTKALFYSLDVFLKMWAQIKNYIHIN